MSGVEGRVCGLRPCKLRDRLDERLEGEWSER